MVMIAREHNLGVGAEFADPAQDVLVRFRDHIENLIKEVASHNEDLQGLADRLFGSEPHSIQGVSAAGKTIGTVGEISDLLASLEGGLNRLGDIKSRLLGLG